MTKNIRIVLSFWFLSGLLILLLNDFIFKELYGNWLTGKLSDFAGLFVFPLFWTALFPRHKTKIFWLTGLMFIFWKSSYSQTFIEYWNNLGLLPVSRVVDYTDLMALSVLPFAFHIERYKEELSTLKIQPIFPLLIASFSFMATSYFKEAQMNKIHVNKAYEFNFSKDTLQVRFSRIDSLNFGNEVRLTEANPDTLRILIPYDFCANQLETHIVIEELSNLKIRMTLIDASHFCSPSESDKEDAVRAFEKMIVDKIRNSR